MRSSIVGLLEEDGDDIDGALRPLEAGADDDALAALAAWASSLRRCADAAIAAMRSSMVGSPPDDEGEKDEDEDEEDDDDDDDEGGAYGKPLENEEGAEEAADLAALAARASSLRRCADAAIAAMRSSIDAMEMVDFAGARQRQGRPPAGAAVAGRPAWTADVKELVPSTVAAAVGTKPMKESMTAGGGCVGGKGRGGDR